MDSGDDVKPAMNAREAACTVTKGATAGGENERIECVYGLAEMNLGRQRPQQDKKRCREGNARTRGDSTFPRADRTGGMRLDGCCKTTMRERQ